MEKKDPLLNEQNQELSQFVNNIIKDMQTRFSSMTDSLLTRIDDMSERIDELERSLNEISETTDSRKLHERTVS